MSDLKLKKAELNLCKNNIKVVGDFILSISEKYEDEPTDEEYLSDKKELIEALSYSIRAMFLQARKLCNELNVDFDKDFMG